MSIDGSIGENTSLQYFFQFFKKDAIEYIVTQTNLYAAQKIAEKNARSNGEKQMGEHYL